ncbi:MAG: proteasome assembly chaperone family protein [Haloglomus sp.]
MSVPSSDSTATSAHSFEITTEGEPSGTLLAGFSQFGLAGLTAVDYLVDHLDLEQSGYVTTDSLPTITPFENGRPRHHTRLFSRADLDVTVLVGELIVPQAAARPLSNTIVDWMGENAVDEVAVLSGVPVPHGPEQHQTFYIATDDFHERRLTGAEVPPMGSGFLDGVNAELLSRGIDSPLAAGVFVTPVHAQAPDVEAAIRLLDTVADIYDLQVDTGPLEAFAAEVAQYYEDLAERVENVEEAQRPEDRMYV